MLSDSHRCLVSPFQIKKQTTITLDDITYQPFRKDFYIEVPELAQMSAAEVDAMRAEMEGITVSAHRKSSPLFLVRFLLIFFCWLLYVLR